MNYGKFRGRFSQGKHLGYEICFQEKSQGYQGKKSHRSWIVSFDIVQYYQRDIYDIDVLSQCCNICMTYVVLKLSQLL